MEGMQRHTLIKELCSSLVIRGVLQGSGEKLLETTKIDITRRGLRIAGYMKKRL